MSILILNRKDCCGCEACAQKCPQNCISMEQDSEGFSYPHVDDSRCTTCKLCESVCPVLNAPDVRHEYVLAAYAAYSKNETIRLKSSSGGIFSILAENILAQDGIVFGAAFDASFGVQHSSVRTVKDLEKLRGSKYTQSRTGNCYGECEAYLKAGQQVLFTGTPCQIAGLQSYLGKTYDNLLAVDILCHGVPSPKFLQYYLNIHKKVNSSDITDVKMRDKSEGWLNYQMKISFDNSYDYKISFQNDPFMRIFLSELCLRPSCHACRFKNLARPSDMTLGDAWGIQNLYPEIFDDRGTSIILLHTPKGQKFFTAIQSQLVWRRGDADTLLPPNADSRKSVVAHPNRSRFFAMLDKEEPPFVALTSLLHLSLWQRIVRKLQKKFGKFLRQTNP